MITGCELGIHTVLIHTHYRKTSSCSFNNGLVNHCIRTGLKKSSCLIAAFLLFSLIFCVWNELFFFFVLSEHSRCIYYYLYRAIKKSWGILHWPLVTFIVVLGARKFTSLFEIRWSRNWARCMYATIIFTFGRSHNHASYKYRLRAAQKRYWYQYFFVTFMKAIY